LLSKTIKSVSWTFIILTSLFLLTSCSIPFIPEVPPASYSVEAAINVLANKYMLLDTGWINGFGDMELGEGRYATFDGVAGFLMVFKYEDPDQAKASWDKITKRWGLTVFLQSVWRTQICTVGIKRIGYLLSQVTRLKNS
jgi:hypothetical protein